MRYRPSLLARFFPRSPLGGRPAAALIAALAAVSPLAACDVFDMPVQSRGNRVEAEHLKELNPGVSTRADVTALIGSPTIKAPFDDNTWIYVGSVTKSRIGRTPGVLSQQAVVLTFDDGGVLRGIETRTEKDSLPVTVSERSTPSPGTEASFMQQLFGNIGRFNAAGASAGGGPSGGAPKPF